jgi:hypothetical protein
LTPLKKREKLSLASDLTMNSGDVLKYTLEKTFHQNKPQILQFSIQVVVWRLSFGVFQK